MSDLFGPFSRHKKPPVESISVFDSDVGRQIEFGVVGRLRVRQQELTTRGQTQEDVTTLQGRQGNHIFEAKRQTGG